MLWDFTKVIALSRQVFMIYFDTNKLQEMLRVPVISLEEDEALQKLFITGGHK